MASETPRKLFKLERMLAFSDGVFAVVITLLVLDLRLPAIPSDTSAALVAALLAMWPKLLIFCFTFVIIGMCWIEHHRKFSYVHQVDKGLMWLNLGYLMVLCLVPFATNVFSEHGNPAAFAFYAGIMTLVSLLSTVLAAYALRPPFLTEVGVHALARQDMILSPFSNTAIFLTSTVLAAAGWASPAHWILLLMIPASAYTGLRAGHR